ncbi:MAG: LLM class flavin-dependent oxidoreductase [Actinomycetota bacterium]|jgi:alkanesulfonate monooxygenase SsuD/methylene tetrahydromethanopterin reductase-like flavin-dependent oxidoreductase (luciferase family)
MRIGVGLPTSTPPLGARHRGPELLAWSTRAEAGPFTSLGVTDRLVYDCTDPLMALTAAAAVTTRLRLVTMVAIGPIRPAALLAAQAASLDALSGGRLTLGVSLGARPDDYDAAGASWRGRGRQLSDQLAAMRDIWEGTTVGPRPASAGGPDLLVGGGSGAAFLRAARHADGYVHGGGPPRAFASAADRARAAWADAGRPGEPQLWGQSYFSLADPEAGAAYLRHYYAFTGPFAERVAAGLLDSPKAVREQVAGYAEAGCDELVLLPATSDPSELDRLADALA